KPKKGSMLASFRRRGGRSNLGRKHYAYHTSLSANRFGGRPCRHEPEPQHGLGRRASETEEKGRLQGWLRADGEQQSLASGSDPEHEGRSREAGLAARLHRRGRLGR